MLVRNGRIEAIGAKVKVPPGVTRIALEGVVFPGLVDVHNHLTWNVLPHWSLPHIVKNRYEWQSMSEYAARLENPRNQLFAAGRGCDMQRFAEVKALLGGATSTLGSLGATAVEPQRNKCVEGLARNLDVFSGLYSEQLNSEPLRYVTAPLELDWKEVASLRDGLASGSLRSAIFHVSEGVDAASRREFAMFKAQGLLRSGATIVHGVALQAPDFEEMAVRGVGLVWSPRSNRELYGRTADIRAAKAANVQMAIAPDWSPTGSSGMLAELREAARWNVSNGSLLSDTELLAMVTSNPARLAGVADRVAALKPGMMADFIVLAARGGSPIRALLESIPSSLRLIAVGGRPILGDISLLRRFDPAGPFQTLSVCGRTVGLDAKEQLGGDSWASITNRLDAALRQAGLGLATLDECQ